VSKTHCRIDKDFSGFVLTDTSTNGVYINEEPVGFGLPRLLQNGDVLKLGDAVVLARIEDGPVSGVADTRQAVPNPAPKIIPAPRIIPDGPFGIPEQAALPGESPAPAAAPTSPVTAAAARILDDWWASEEPFGSLGNPISVDISAKAALAAIPNITSGKEPLPSERGDVAKLADSLAGIDLTVFAGAVDRAARVLSEEERHRFQGRLRDLLVGNEPQRR
jgi:type VI secretion system protein ImpI